MKKLLLSALLLGITGISQAQNARMKAATGIVDMADKLKNKFQVPLNEGKGPVMKNQQGPEGPLPEAKTALMPVATPTVQWKTIASSMNIYGMLVSQSRPLNYHDNLDAVTFLHRKGNSSGTTFPASNSGSMIFRISNNWGNTWDSSCVWADGANLARYPQGGLYNPVLNTNMSGAYLVGMGPVTNGNNWIGSWYASKQAGSANYDYTASPAPGAMQFIANTPPFQAGLTKHDYPRYSFTSTDDGKVRALAARYYTVNAGNPSDFRGAAIVKGTFNAGTFNWTSDTLIPSAVTKTDGTKQLWDQPIMAWNDSGNVGYVVFIGALSSASLSNRGWQPIVYKTTNGGGSWNSISGIDFNSPSMQGVKDHIGNVNVNPTLTIPFFNVGEGYDAVVDCYNKLHIISTIVGTARANDDSLAFTYRFGTENYSWSHTPGDRPYVYDFIGDGLSPWTYLTIDSLSSEGPGAGTNDPGYGANLWDPDPNNNNLKVSSDSRIQGGRTPDGKYILYTWAESDTNFTTNQLKWNSIPNVKVRCLASYIGNSITSLFVNEWGLTRPSTVVPVTYTNNTNVSNRGMFHYQSPTARCMAGCLTPSITINLPVTVSNSSPYSQLTENKHWYTTAMLPFYGYITAVEEQKNSQAMNVQLFPNPTNSEFHVYYELKNDSKVEISMHNLLGQEVKKFKTAGNTGMNEFSADVSHLNAGAYFITVDNGSSKIVKKLIVE